MRKKETKNEVWLQRTFRVRAEIMNMYKYLEFHASQNEISKDILFEKIVNFSLDYIDCESNDISYQNEILRQARLFNYYDVNVRRQVKGFTLSQNTLERLLKVFKDNDTIKIGQIIEVLIGLYTEKHLRTEEIVMLITRLNSNS